MARRKTGRRRGRPRLTHAKRRTTTRIGRRTGFDPVDTGTLELRQRKRRATGREDLPIDGAAVVFGHGQVDREQFDKLGLIPAGCSGSLARGGRRTAVSPACGTPPIWCNLNTCAGGSIVSPEGVHQPAKGPCGAR